MGSNDKMQNKNSVIWGTAIGLSLLLIGIEAAQLLVAIIANAEVAYLDFAGFYFVARIDFAMTGASAFAAFTYLFPVLFSLFLIEVSTRIISLSKPGPLRYKSIIIQLLLVGYTLVKLFYSTFIMVLAPEYDTDWNNFLFYGDFGSTIKYLTTLILLIMIVAYLGNTTARIKKYIDVR